ncbi:MAG: aspartate-semialdehyde dehydrogenase [Firmicutes bacterium HGW-Firmicutes-12]|jgi:aspartate-semialdehyde dehydrogenase|nr:MAG: aspartate-semialdehyde dehydrogenase [Firmicutes bacterium HGW-Firmicutes-12]
MKEYKIAVVGLGAVGREMLATLERSTLPISEVVPLVRRNEGEVIEFRGQMFASKLIEKGSFKDIDIALFSAGEEASLILAPMAIEEGAVVIDNSNAFRMNADVPLVVPEVNPADAQRHNGLIANPNCSTIQMVVALKPIHDRFKIKRIVVSTYQAVSGTGYQAIDELKQQMGAFINEKEIPCNVYPHQISLNVLPHIDKFMDNGYTKEEMKMFNETKKIMGDASIQVTATTVRVPVIRCHSEAVNIETEKPMPDVAEIKEIMAQAPGVVLADDVENNIYPLALDCAGKYEVFVGRIRKDYTIENGLNMWVVSDNLLKGAALNAVQIAELLVEKDWVKPSSDKKISFAQ